MSIRMGISHRLMTSLLSSSGRCCWYCSSYGSVVQWSRCAHSSTARSTVTYGIPSDLERRRWSVWPMTSIGNNDRIRCDVKVHQSRRRNIFLQPSKEKYDDERTKEKFDELSSLYGTNRFNEDEDEDFNQGSVHDEDNSLDPSDTSKELICKELPPARNVKVKTADFLKSSVNHKDCPPPVYPEFAIIGRSNVGKSSLINMLTGRNALAMVSKTPGKTVCINHFLINKSWYLVDLPGYGYARRSKENIAGWNKFTREYFLERENLTAVLLLVDASIPPLELDLECASWLNDAEVPFIVVYTKLDKKKKGMPPAEENIAAFENYLMERHDALPPSIATSSRTGKGKTELLTLIAQLRSSYNSSSL